MSYSIYHVKSLSNDFEECCQAYLGGSWALRCPERVDKLVLLEPWGLGSPDDPKAAALKLPREMMAALVPTLSYVSG